MQIIKTIWFDNPGEKQKLTEIIEASSDESSAAIAISQEFKKDFSEAMFIAAKWTEVINKKKVKE